MNKLTEFEEMEIILRLLRHQSFSETRISQLIAADATHTADLLHRLKLQGKITLDDYGRFHIC